MMPHCHLAGPNLCRLESLFALRRLVLDGLAILKRLETCAGDVRVMNEQILAAIIRDDEAKTLLLTEPFDRSLCHFVFSLDPEGPIQQRPSFVIRGMLRGREVYTMTHDPIITGRYRNCQSNHIIRGANQPPGRTCPAEASLMSSRAFGSRRFGKRTLGDVTESDVPSARLSS